MSSLNNYLFDLARILSGFLTSTSAAPLQKDCLTYRKIWVMQNERNCHETLWNPMNFFETPQSYKYAVIVLNRPIEIKKSILMPLWEKAQVTVTVDSGTDRWMKYIDDLASDVYDGKCNVYAPTIITGDMDSILLDTLDKLEKVGVKVIKTLNQDRTDYTKALMELADHCKIENLKLDAIYVIIESSGRFDHIIGNINTLYRSLEFFDNTQVIQIASNSMTWLMRPGRHRIIIPESLVREKSWCGLLPFGSRIDKVLTTGLKWNLDNMTLEFGGMVSTSNTYSKDCTEVTVDVNDKLVWTMGIEPLVEKIAMGCNFVGITLVDTVYINHSIDIYYLPVEFYLHLKINDPRPVIECRTKP